jgi:hypothetical protein
MEESPVLRESWTTVPELRLIVQRVQNRWLLQAAHNGRRVDFDFPTVFHFEHVGAATDSLAHTSAARSRCDLVIRTLKYLFARAVVDIEKGIMSLQPFPNVAMVIGTSKCTMRVHIALEGG